MLQLPMWIISTGKESLQLYIAVVVTGDGKTCSFEHLQTELPKFQFPGLKIDYHIGVHEPPKLVNILGFYAAQKSRNFH